MKILVVGAAGMIGRKLVERLARDGALGGAAITGLDAVDVIAPSPPPAPFPIRTDAADIAAAYIAPKLVAGWPDVIFWLASIVSGEAEADLEKGYAINLDGTRFLLEAIRAEQALSGGAWKPRLVFTSSIAVFGAPFPEAIDDDFHQTPMTSYGTQKAICELLISDYSRRGFLDGVSIRLPTICVRPGKPNKAASGFFSGIIREPLAGQEAVLPVPETVRHWFASPAAAVGFLVHAAGLDLAAIGPRISLTMPGISATVAEEIEALRRVAGDKAVALIRREPDAIIARIVTSWPEAFEPEAALSLGFRADASFDAIVAQHVAEFHGG